ncbi:medium-chain specific acyl-CoA dehydrogenase, mitochondrial-like [Panonychus citri]|uniref:medium-chain specific acyl-CoA dehydrogenase, mitochondrial-like n=1 Tax=Panonychus citri TaxID=50023 RepID=UPI002307DDA3|nr:medium-chain specific acyl-CoA dehydrogenase, mitochondrial-like [Panonychus citri]
MDLIEKIHSLGLMNFFIPLDYGGLGVDFVDSLLIQEQLGYGCTGISMAMALNGLTGSSIVKYGSIRQKEKYLTHLAKKPSFTAFCVTEPGTGSDVAGIQTSAKPVSPTEWVLNGEKAWISNASTADVYCVLARSAQSADVRPSQAFTMFLIDKGTPGVRIGKKEINLGQRCADTRSISLDNVKLTSESILGSIGEGFKITMAAFDYQRPILACNAVGLAQRALDEATKYALERQAFGKPIANYQAIQFKLANMAIGIESARLVYMKAGWAYQTGQPITLLASIAKTLAADVANQSATEAVQVFGGSGFNSDYPVEKLMRDAKLFHIYGGTVEIQRMVIAREIIKKVSSNQ